MALKFSRGICVASMLAGSEALLPASPPAAVFGGAFAYAHSSAPHLVLAADVRVQRRQRKTALCAFPQLPGGPGPPDQDLINKLKRDSSGNPRLSIAIALVLRGMLRLLLGASARVDIRARSNRDICLGRLSKVLIEVGVMKGLLLSARGASLAADQLDLGPRPSVIFLYLAFLIFGVGDVFSLTLLALVAYYTVGGAAAGSCVRYSLSLSEADLNASVIGVALGALMRNSMLVSAVSAAAQQMRDKKGQDISSVGELVKAADYRLESVKLENPGFWGGGARCRLLMRATAVTGGGGGAATGVGTGATGGAGTGPSFEFKVRANIEAKPAGTVLMTMDGAEVLTTNQCVLTDPAILVTPGWPLPDFWLPVGAGVALDLGATNCLETLDFMEPQSQQFQLAAGAGGGIVKPLNGDGGLNVGGRLLLGSKEPPPPYSRTDKRS